ncbi:hypothetical protein H8S20_07055 [Clostridium sp. NSJ-6]|uniref:2'-5' RNA ligase n=1 Tax=Clostridium hominis TaxID=2763036 RepID=A0ABR7DB71_9CLOT|nr:hypothetical protein [Clostridium hominis]MBC5628644.1 hypothetical protein [Clostridium hominis]MDU2674127.1 hypothetical protein [Clostridium sp.]
MKYYLVALFDDESYKNLSPVQRNLSKKYRANRNSPIPYIPLEVLENPNVDKLNVVIDKIIKPYKHFKVEVSSKVSICDSNKTLNLKIEDVGYIKRLNRLLSDNLQLHGFNVKGIETDENLQLTLANVNYNNKDNKRVINPLDSRFNLSTLKVNRLELWKISNTRRETLIQTYPLKDF